MNERRDRAARRGTAAADHTARHPNLVLAATILASSLSFIDGSVVNVGLPAIKAGFASDAAGLQWVINGYLLPLSALLLLGGALSDRFGRRRLLMAGLVLFALASAACAVAPTLGILVAGRIVQGIGAALLTPSSLAILGDTFTGAARGRAIGTWAAVGAATSGLGPPLGGWLIDGIGWRAIFAINLPLAAAAFLLAWRCVPNRRGDTGRALDPTGTLLATIGLGCLTFGLIDGSAPSGRGLATALALGGGVAALGCFVAWEHRRGSGAMMPLAMFGSRAFVGLTLLTLLLYGALGALVVVLPYGLMRAGGLTAAMAGGSLVPLTATLALLSPVLGRLAGWFGTRPFLMGGPVTVGLGLLLLLRLDVGSAYLTTLLPALIVTGLGLAGAVAPLTTGVLASVDPRLTGTASGFNTAVARTGGLVATACLGPVLAANGDALVAAAHATAIVAAAACFAAASCAALLPPTPSRRAAGHGGAAS